MVLEHPACKPGELSITSLLFCFPLFINKRLGREWVTSWVETLIPGFWRACRCGVHQTIPSPSVFPLLDHWICPRSTKEFLSQEYSQDIHHFQRASYPWHTATEGNTVCGGWQYQLQHSANSTQVVFSTFTGPLEKDVSLLTTSLIYCPTLLSKGSAI